MILSYLPAGAAVVPAGAAGVPAGAAVVPVGAAVVPAGAAGVPAGMNTGSLAPGLVAAVVAPGSATGGGVGFGLQV